MIKEDTEANIDHDNLDLTQIHINHLILGPSEYQQYEIISPGDKSHQT